jgi:uncharacterized protein YjbI with pentapeptide repeats
MADEKHTAQLEYCARVEHGNVAWGHWRSAHPDIRPDLSGANLYRANLSEVDLSGANLSRTNLSGANLRGADLSRADLRGAYLSQANLFAANLSGSDLTEANLSGVNLLVANLSGVSLLRASLNNVALSGADLSRADLREAYLMGSVLVETNFEGADLTGCFVYGVSAWNLKLEGTKQLNLVITRYDEPVITVDNLEVAQFIYLLLHNKKIREVIDTNTSKAVLILGRFTPKRKAVLDAIREELRRQNYLPILFDFEKPATRNFTETISTLAHIARFIIADITEAKSIPQELERIIPDLPSVPVQPILQASAKEYGMFLDFKNYPWMLETYRYQNVKGLITALPEKVIAPAESKAPELVGPMKHSPRQDILDSGGE